MTTPTENFIPQGQALPNTMGCQKCTKRMSPWDPSYLAGSSNIWECKRTGKNPQTPCGKIPHHVHNTQDFIHSIKDIKIQDHQCMMSYDVYSLFTSIPIDPAISIIRRQLEQDKDLHQRTNMTVNHICCLLEFCLKNTFFQYKGRYYEQTEGAAMGSLISP